MSIDITVTDMFCGEDNEHGKLTTICHYCGKEVEAHSSRKMYCSEKCKQRAFRGYPPEYYSVEIACLQCSKIFTGHRNRKFCSERCNKNYRAKAGEKWLEERPGIQKQYQANRKKKTPDIWKERSQKQRLNILELLGGQCIVCGITNPSWLHVDYIPTMRGKSHRHPRHIAYIQANRNNFRLLCANHHYELTLTSAIEGTNITQEKGVYHEE